MRTFATLALAGGLAVVVQTSLLRHVPLLPAAPDLILILVVYLGLHYRSASGAVGAFLLGYLLDTFSGAAPGLYCLTMTTVFGVVYLLSKRLWMENPVSNVAAVALGEGLKMVIVVGFFAFAVRGAVSWLAVSKALGFEALFALLCTPPVFTLLNGQLRPLRTSRSREAE